jgi:hypothetical protein
LREKNQELEQKCIDLLEMLQNLDNAHQTCPITHTGDVELYSAEIKNMETFLEDCNPANTLGTTTATETTVTIPPPLGIYLAETLQDSSRFSSSLYLPTDSVTDSNLPSDPPLPSEFLSFPSSGVSKRARTPEASEESMKRSKLGGQWNGNDENVLQDLIKVNSNATFLEEELHMLRRQEDSLIFDFGSSLQDIHRPDWTS